MRVLLNWAANGKYLDLNHERVGAYNNVTFVYNLSVLILLYTNLTTEIIITPRVSISLNKHNTNSIKKYNDCTF